jgi:hypothetical protein
MASITATATLVSSGDDDEFPPLHVADVVPVLSGPAAAAAAAEEESGGEGREELIELLKQEMGLTQGLAETIVNSSEESVRRYWIVDNSGSMSTPDGKKIIQDRQGKNHLVHCSRWEELGQSLLWQAKVSAILGAPTEFRLLNKPARLSSQNITVGVGAGVAVDVAEVKKIMKTNPVNETPLCKALRSVITDIQALAPELAAKGQTVSVIIASDGEATDGTMEEVMETMKPLSDLPCDVVVRLCTDDESVVKYWNDIEVNPELELDVLDDIGGEGDEVRRLNPWLGYGEALHRVREFGAAPKLLDFIDERPLEIPEASEFMTHLLGEQITNSFPHAQIHKADYSIELKKALEGLPKIFDASQKKVVPWIDFVKFFQQYLKN